MEDVDLQGESDEDEVEYIGGENTTLISKDDDDISISFSVRSNRSVMSVRGSVFNKSNELDKSKNSIGTSKSKEHMDAKKRWQGTNKI